MSWLTKMLNSDEFCIWLMREISNPIQFWIVVIFGMLRLTLNLTPSYWNVPICYMHWFIYFLSKISTYRFVLFVNIHFRSDIQLCVLYIQPIPRRHLVKIQQRQFRRAPLLSFLYWPVCPPPNYPPATVLICLLPYKFHAPIEINTGCYSSLMMRVVPHTRISEAQYFQHNIEPVAEELDVCAF